MVYKKKKSGKSNLNRKYKTKRRVKDLNEINDDLKPENTQKLLNQPIDYDKPGSAQFYCIHCARYFINQHTLEHHFTSKPHKRRLKALEAEPYTIEDSERAAGHGNWKSPIKRKIETQSQVRSSSILPKPEDGEVIVKKFKTN